MGSSTQFRSVGCFAVLATVATSNAVIEMDQIGTNPAHMSVNTVLSMDSPSGHYQAFDDFVPSTLRVLNWIEAHVRVTNYALGPSWASTAYWRVDLYNDSGNQPGVIIASITTTANLLYSTGYALNQGSSFSNALVNIPLPGWAVVGGQRYWIAVSPHEPGTRQFGISVSNFTGGFPMNGSCWSLWGGVSSFFPVDLAYRIDGI